MIIVSGTGCYFGITGAVSGTAVTGPVQQFQVSVDDGTGLSCTPGIFDNPWTEPFGDAYVDYVLNDAEDDGEIYAYDSKPISIIISGGTELQGILAGRCFIAGGSYYCSYVVDLPGGAVAFRGFWEEMTIIAGNGCYRGLTGTVGAEGISDGFMYTFDLE